MYDKFRVELVIADFLLTSCTEKRERDVRKLFLMSHYFIRSVVMVTFISRSLTQYVAMEMKKLTLFLFTLKCYM